MRTIMVWLAAMTGTLGLFSDRLVSLIYTPGVAPTLLLYAVSSALIPIFARLYVRLGPKGRAYYVLLAISASATFSGLVSIALTPAYMGLGSYAIPAALVIYGGLTSFSFKALSAHPNIPNVTDYWCDAFWPKGGGIKTFRPSSLK